MFAGSLIALAAGLAAAAPRVLVVQSDDYAAYTDPVPAFLESLGEPATVVNLHGQRREAETLQKRLRDTAPRVAFCLGAKAAWTVRQAAPDLPIVYAAIAEPGRYDIPGRGVTGIERAVHPAQYLAQVRAFLPDVQRIGVLHGPGLSAVEDVLLTDAAAESGVEIVRLRASTTREVRQALRDAPDIDALWLKPDRDMLTADAFRALTEETRRKRLPLLVETDAMVKAGGLFAVIPDPAGIGVQAAGLVRATLDDQAPEGEIYPDLALVSLNLQTLELSGVPFDRELLGFVDQLVD